MNITTQTNGIRAIINANECISYTTETHKRKFILYLLSQSIVSIVLYGSIGINYVNHEWYNVDVQARTIQKAWRQYRIRTARTRNDLVIHGLAEYWFHPSRVLLKSMSSWFFKKPCSENNVPILLTIFSTN